MPAREIAPPPTIEGETDEQLKLMRAGEPYLAMDPYLMRLRQWGQDQVFKLNAVVNMEERMDLMREFVGMPEGDKREVCIMTPFICEYGFNLSFGKEVYIGPNCTMLDVNRISFGDRTMVGANCSFYTPGHPISPEERNGGAGPEWGKEIIVGDDCWIGGSVVIVGPCHIGNGVTIGAGSVVTKDIPDRCVAVGNPARVVKKINADGSLERVARA